MNYHKSVLTREVLTYLDPQPNKVYVDATFGGGGHTRALLEKEPDCKIIGIDWDKSAHELNGHELVEEFPDRLQLVWGNFSQITQLLKKIGVTRIDGILADFGTSQFQIHEKEGFSFAVDTPLDMRMSAGHYKITAADIVNKATEQEIADILYQFGEESAARRIARAIIEYRTENGPIIKTTGQLATLISQVVRPHSRRIHPATKTFQALRIFVNNELNNIKSLLTQSIPLLAPQGRLVCISFHSLEDRLVKQFFKQHEAEFTILTRKVVMAQEDELRENPSARSAKLRAVEKK
jgi:16S rRNA (cytosine1402-N4)-methyltransferase